MDSLLQSFRGNLDVRYVQHLPVLIAFKKFYYTNESSELWSSRLDTLVNVFGELYTSKLPYAKVILRTINRGYGISYDTLIKLTEGSEYASAKELRKLEQGKVLHNFDTMFLSFSSDAAGSEEVSYLSLFNTPERSNLYKYLHHYMTFPPENRNPSLRGDADDKFKKYLQALGRLVHAYQTFFDYKGSYGSSPYNGKRLVGNSSEELNDTYLSSSYENFVKLHNSFFTKSNEVENHRFVRMLERKSVINYEAIDHIYHLVKLESNKSGVVSQKIKRNNDIKPLDSSFLRAIEFSKCLKSGEELRGILGDELSEVNDRFSKYCNKVDKGIWQLGNTDNLPRFIQDNLMSARGNANQDVVKQRALAIIYLLSIMQTSTQRADRESIQKLKAQWNISLETSRSLDAPISAFGSCNINDALRGDLKVTLALNLNNQQRRAKELMQKEVEKLTQDPARDFKEKFHEKILDCQRVQSIVQELAGVFTVHSDANSYRQFLYLKFYAALCKGDKVIANNVLKEIAENEEKLIEPETVPENEVFFWYYLLAKSIEKNEANNVSTEPNKPSFSNPVNDPSVKMSDAQRAILKELLEAEELKRTLRDKILQYLQGMPANTDPANHTCNLPEVRTKLKFSRGTSVPYAIKYEVHFADCRYMDIPILGYSKGGYYAENLLGLSYLLSKTAVERYHNFLVKKNQDPSVILPSLNIRIIGYTDGHPINGSISYNNECTLNSFYGDIPSNVQVKQQEYSNPNNCTTPKLLGAKLICVDLTSSVLWASPPNGILIGGNPSLGVARVNCQLIELNRGWKEQVSQFKVDFPNLTVPEPHLEVITRFTTDEICRGAEFRGITLEFEYSVNVFSDEDIDDISNELSRNFKEWIDKEGF